MWQRKANKDEHYHDIGDLDILSDLKSVLFRGHITKELKERAERITK